MNITDFKRGDVIIPSNFGVDQFVVKETTSGYVYPKMMYYVHLEDIGITYSTDDPNIMPTGIKEVYRDGEKIWESLQL